VPLSSSVTFQPPSHLYWSTLSVCLRGQVTFLHPAPSVAQMPNPQQTNIDFGKNTEFWPLSTGAIPKTGTDALMLGAKLFYPDELKKSLEPPLMKLYSLELESLHFRVPV
jgi:hypothetical protein